MDGESPKKHSRLNPNKIHIKVTYLAVELILSGLLIVKTKQGAGYTLINILIGNNW